MRPSVSATMWAGWLSLCFLAAVSAESVIEVYGKLGGEVALDPKPQSPIKTITWKDGSNLAMDWDGSTAVDAYRHFKERGHLNISTGVMTIKGLTRSDEAVYTPEINGTTSTPFRLIVISPVPKPAVSHACVDEMSSCELTCTGDTTGAEPVTYTWMADDQNITTDSSKTITIAKEKYSDIKGFSCELSNLFSKKNSEEIDNPIINPPPPKLRISAGLTVLVSMVSIVVVLALVHKWTTGDWFFQKESMPWQPDFWKKEPRAAAGSNGTTAALRTDETDEESPMH